ncbi:hypothetical protein WAI453_001973 [Rhynchosporium graminicola]|uniref:Transmembrane protein n=1 Tax=Rhynchosporium graminicola TaxID=2792576 RepID=A0A1E1LRL3_9HELO|nr:uncharacterized protein RCO7_06344 [Rhynchosporium commune]
MNPRAHLAMLAAHVLANFLSMPATALKFETSNSPTPTAAVASVADQKTTDDSSPTAEPHKGMSTGHLVGVALGVAGGISIIALMILWEIVRKKNIRLRKEEEERLAAEAAAAALLEETPRSVRTNRGSMLLWHELTTGAVRDHPSNTDIRDFATSEKSQMLPDDVFGIPGSPAELPVHFALARPRSRIYEVV